jgi:hypothetical protein
VPKSLIAVNHVGGYALVDHELWEKEIREKASVEELKLSKLK